MKLFQSEVAFPEESQLIDQIQRNKVKVDKQVKSIQEMLNSNKSLREVRRQLDRLLELYEESSINHRIVDLIDSDYRRFQQVCIQTRE